MYYVTQQRLGSRTPVVLGSGCFVLRNVFRVFGQQTAAKQLQAQRASVFACCSDVVPVAAILQNHSCYSCSYG